MSYRYYRNSEGYSDPTAGAALGNVMREQKKTRTVAVRKSRSRERQRANRRLKHQREALQRRMAASEVAE
jgi:hypothetical protein